MDNPEKSLVPTSSIAFNSLDMIRMIEDELPIEVQIAIFGTPLAQLEALPQQIDPRAINLPLIRHFFDTLVERVEDGEYAKNRQTLLTMNEFFRERVNGALALSENAHKRTEKDNLNIIGKLARIFGIKIFLSNSEKIAEIRAEINIYREQMKTAVTDAIMKDNQDEVPEEVQEASIFLHYLEQFPLFDDLSKFDHNISVTAESKINSLLSRIEMENETYNNPKVTDFTSSVPRKAEFALSLKITFSAEMQKCLLIQDFEKAISSFRNKKWREFVKGDSY